MVMVLLGGKGGVMGVKEKDAGGMVGVRPGGTRQVQELYKHVGVQPTCVREFCQHGQDTTRNHVFGSKFGH